MSDIIPYIGLLLAIIIAFIIIKKVTSCMVKTVVGLTLLAVLAYVYYAYLR